MGPGVERSSQLSPPSVERIKPSGLTAFSNSPGCPEPRKRSGPATVKPIVSCVLSPTRTAWASLAPSRRRPV